MTRSSLFTALIATVLTVACGTGRAEAAPPLAGVDEIPKQLRPAIGQLRVSKTPVLLPTWLPARCKGPVDVNEGPFTGGYEVGLGTCSADTTFFTSGGKGTVQKTRRKVMLANGRAAYVQNLKDFCFDWSEGKLCYRVGLPGFGTKEDIQKMVKIANSMKLMSPDVMRKEPKGEDALTKAYARIESSKKDDDDIRLGQLYEQSMVAFSNGKYDLAKRNLESVANQWHLCWPVPPLAQIEMALAQVLRKAGNNSQAEAIEHKYKEQAVKAEEDLKASVIKDKTALDAAINAHADTSSPRMGLGRQHRLLADFYVATGKFPEAEDLYKSAINDVAPVFGKQCSDARESADAYEVLLKIWGHDPSAAHKL